MRPAIRLFFLLVACWVTATACSDTSTTDGATQSGSADAATDTGGLSGLTDLGKIGQDTDSAVLDIADGGSGDDELGQPCQEPSDCKSGWCVQGPFGKVCSKPCSVNCEPGWTCSQVQVPGTTDTAFICLPKYMHLCQPCANSAECNDNGGLEHKCMPFGDACHKTSSAPARRWRGHGRRSPPAPSRTNSAPARASASVAAAA
jgi:hypothetical protein